MSAAMPDPAPRLPRAALRLTCAVLLALATGCGREADSGPRLTLKVADFDGAPPEVVHARWLGPGEAQEPVRIVPASGGEPAEYVVPGGADGAYEFTATGGWWMLRLGVSAPELERGGAAVPVAFGRAHTLYVVPRGAGEALGADWGAARVADDGTREPVAVEVLLDAGGRRAGLRFSPADWHGQMEAIGRLADGSLCQVLTFLPSEEGAPRLLAAERSPSFPLDVLLVPARPDLTVDGVTVRVRVEGIPLDAPFTAQAKGGVARFFALPTLGRPLRVDAVGGLPPVRHALDAWLAESELRVLYVPAEEGLERRVAAEQASTISRAQVRPKGADSYGLVPFRVRDGKLLYFGPAEHDGLLVQAGDLVGRAPAGDAAVLSFAPAVRFHAAVEGAPLGTVVRLRSTDGGVTAQGFSLRTSPGSTIDAVLPAGHYDVEVETQPVPWRRAAPLDLSEPGIQVHVPLVVGGR